MELPLLLLVDAAAAVGKALTGTSSLFTEILYIFLSTHYWKREIIKIYIERFVWKFTYHSMHSTSPLLKTSQKQEDSPHGTRPISTPAMVLTFSPRIWSAVSFHKLLGILSSSGTNIKHAWGSCLFPYSFVTGSNAHCEGSVWNSW